jgi:hypothetical protein
MTEPGVTGSLAGAGFAFHSNTLELTEYARQHLATLVAAAPVPAVRATLRWHDGQPQVSELRDPAALARMERVDRDLYVGDGVLRWFRVDDLRDLYLQIRWDGDHLEVEGDFFYRLGNSRLSDAVRRMRQWRRRAMMRQRRFPTLLAYLVYYPCWWWLEQTRGLHPIHAAGVATADGTVLLAGASGVGKSTLSVAVALSPGARLLSDSFVLHEGPNVVPVREPVLLDAFSRAWLGAKANELRPLGRQYGLKRSGYHLPAERLAEAGRASLLVFPRRSPEPYVRPVSSEAACQRLSSGDLMINDLRRYWAFAAVLEQLAPSGLMARREAQLAALARSVTCYDFGMTPSMSSDAATAALLDLLRGKTARAAGTGS